MFQLNFEVFCKILAQKTLNSELQCLPSFIFSVAVELGAQGVWAMIKGSVDFAHLIFCLILCIAHPMLECFHRPCNVFRYWFPITTFRSIKSLHKTHTLQHLLHITKAQKILNFLKEKMLGI